MVTEREREIKTKRFNGKEREYQNNEINKNREGNQRKLRKLDTDRQTYRKNNREEQVDERERKREKERQRERDRERLTKRGKIRIGCREAIERERERERDPMTTQ